MKIVIGCMVLILVAYFVIPMVAKRVAREGFYRGVNAGCVTIATEHLDFGIDVTECERIEVLLKDVDAHEFWGR